MELISSAFRTAFRDYCSDGLNLALINNIFDGTGITKGEISPERLMKFSGQRRTLVEAYYASIDWTSQRDVQKFLKALSNFLRLYAREDDNSIRELLQEENVIIEANTVSFANLVNTASNVKNLIFAANGPKPEIVLADAVNNDIKVVRNSEYCLIYDKPILEHGLRWKDLNYWWEEEHKQETSSKSIYMRLIESLDSEPERILFDAYTWLIGDTLPVLIPQVYLHYDPYTFKQLDEGKRLARQRMDFLMLLPGNVRVVIEIDGKQHYSKESNGQQIASPELYAEMVAEDRRLKLAGYEIYRFGGYEFCKPNIKDLIVEFFKELLEHYSVEAEYEEILL